jgi:hypothetical protein
MQQRQPQLAGYTAAHRPADDATRLLFCAAVTTPPHAPPSSIKRYDLSAPKSLWIPSMHSPRPPPRARRMSLPSPCFPAPSLSPLLLLLLAPQPAPPIAPVHCCQTVCNPRQPPLPCSFLFPCPCVFRSCTREPSLPDDACSPSRMLLAPLLPMQWLARFKISKPELMQGCQQVSTGLCQDRWQAFVRAGGGSWVWRLQWLRRADVPPSSVYIVVAHFHIPGSPAEVRSLMCTCRLGCLTGRGCRLHLAPVQLVNRGPEYNGCAALLLLSLARQASSNWQRGAGAGGACATAAANRAAPAAPRGSRHALDGAALPCEFIVR